MSGESLSQRFQVRETLVDNEVETVQRVFDQLLQREALLKTMGPAVRRSLASASERRRVLREARALARVQHEGVIRILDVLEPGNGVQLLLEPVAGESLADKLARTGSLPPEEVRALGLQVASALAAVHHAGFVHRGIAEHAILLRQGGGVCLVGFSFAKAGSHEVTLSSLDYRLARAQAEAPAPPQPQAGLPRYPSPEQLAGQPADPRSDLFALGCVLYRCLAGRALSEADLAPGMAPALPPQVPADLAEAVTSCLARSPMRRPQTALALSEMLSARSRAPAAVRRSVRRTAAGWTAAAILLLLAGGIVWRFSGGTESVPPAGPFDVMGGGQGSPFSDKYRESRAVVIGIGPGYAGSGYAPLPNAERDAGAIAALLPSLGFPNVTPLIGAQADRASIKKAVVNAFLGTHPDDRLLIYYAGHGVRHPTHPEKGCIVPSDARADDRSGIGLLAFEELTSDLFEAQAKHILVALDCCYSGRATHWRGETLAKPLPFAECLRHRVRMVLASSGSDQRAPDGDPGQHSPFASAFLGTLKAQDKEAVRARDLFDAIKTSLRQAKSPVDPRLLDQSAGDGDFVFYLPNRK